jgi:tRNA G10  N-methylase Trm11
MKGSKYKFVTTKENYEDYSSGRVIYGTPGATNFPVRLISEIFQRATARLTNDGINPPYSIYDPFCGAGYSLTILGLLYGRAIKNIYASDINKDILVTANKNLSLLTFQGFDDRTKELQNLKQAFNKHSHEAALESSKRLKEKVSNIQFKTFEFNILSGQNIPIPKNSIDLVLSDLPYGKLTNWEGENSNVDTSKAFLTNIHSILKPKAIVVVSVNKKQKVSYEGYKRLEVLRLGKREVLFLAK